MTTIYHNPRCSKSREALEILETQKEDYEVIKYMDELLSVEKLKELIKLLKIKPIELVRTNESIWKEKFKNSDLTDDELIAAMAKYPKLIERPIVIKANKAVIGRPPKKILEIL
ncbi:arsenate reductase (glutaredoxin) [Gelidibacter japonicus]|jgi:arsenate reductase|uniref:arsenate reductase (glutaredoxin) n=1 Tax=Gelidibacter japonicus TaxID=1962232 RepID=UPI00202127A2|nr:arsenate reductase (glutaredoxin) [Gelidibacter japonicus]MCL8005925.1 arsenate reductase (glutaredoxin) [Gelidibacter japonicus]